MAEPLAVVKKAGDKNTKKKEKCDLDEEIFAKLLKSGIKMDPLLAMKREILHRFCLDECGMTTKEYLAVLKWVKYLKGIKRPIFSCFPTNGTTPWYMFFRKENTWIGHDGTNFIDTTNIFNAIGVTNFQWGFSADGTSYTIYRHSNTTNQLVSDGTSVSIGTDGTTFTKEEYANSDCVRFKFTPSGSPSKWLCVANSSFGVTDSQSVMTRQLRFCSTNIERWTIRFRSSGQHLGWKSDGGGQWQFQSGEPSVTDSVFGWYAILENNKRSLAIKDGDNFYFLQISNEGAVTMSTLTNAPNAAARLSFSVDDAHGTQFYRNGHYLYLPSSPTTLVSQQSANNTNNYCDIPAPPMKRWP